MEPNLEEIRNKFVFDTQKKLRNYNEVNVNNEDDPYRDFLESISAGKCRICKSKLEIVYVEETSSRCSYKFACGHSFSGIAISDTIGIKESLMLRKLPAGVNKFILETIQGWFPSKRIDLSPDGVTKTRIVDRENDYYKEEVIDVKTGRVIRLIEEKLSEHRK